LVSHAGSNPALEKDFLNKLQALDYFVLDIPNLIKVNKREDNFRAKIDLIREIIFRLPYKYK